MLDVAIVVIFVISCKSPVATAVDQLFFLRSYASRVRLVKFII